MKQKESFDAEKFSNQPAPDGNSPAVLVTITGKHYGRMYRHYFQLFQDGQPLAQCSGYIWSTSPAEVEGILKNRVNYYKVRHVVNGRDWLHYSISWMSVANTGKEGYYEVD